MAERDYWRPTSDGPGPSAFWASHPATKAALLALAGVHLLMAVWARIDPAGADGFASLFELSPRDVIGRLRVWQLATYALFHGGMWHLLINGITIWFFGRLVEERLGTRRYALFALGTIVAAALAFLLEAALTDERVPMHGASGFGFGVLVLCALWYPRLTILLFFVLPVPMWAAAALFVVIELMMLLESPGGVAHSAHLGGALYGFLYFRYGGRVDRLFAGIDRWQAKRRRAREEEARRTETDLRREIDRILDKVNREGMGALSEAERRFLKEASARLRR